MSVALVILAGGRAERLAGRIKPLLVRRDGRTLLEHIVQTLSPLADETLICAPRPIASLFAGAVIEDRGEGPAVALAEAARATERDQILLVAGDHVSPSAELAAQLLAMAGDRAAAVSIDGVLQPTFAVYSRRALIALDPPERSLRGTLARISPAVIEAGDLPKEQLASFDDVDTDEDVARHRLSTEGVPTWSHLAGETW